MTKVLGDRPSPSSNPPPGDDGPPYAAHAVDDRNDVDASPEAQLARLLAVLADPAAASGLSLARVSKRSGLPMSTLRRLLTALADADLAVWSLDDKGRGQARLSPAGRALVEEYPAPHSTPPLDPSI
jgi:hypothetical protein